MKKNIIIFYFKTANPAHIQAYISNFDNYPGNIIVKLLYLKNLSQFFSPNLKFLFNNIVNKLSIFFVPHRLQTSFSIFYAFLWWCRGYQVTIIFKKTNFPKRFLYTLSKNFLKFKFVIEIEGDIQAERDYLTEHLSPFSRPSIPTTDAIIDNRIYCEQADKIIAQSPEYAKFLEPHFGKRKIIFRPTGVSNIRFGFNQKVRREARKHYDLNGYITGIYSGLVSYPWQNLTDAVSLINSLYEHNKNYRLLVCVPSSERHIAEKIIGTYDNNSICIQISLTHSEMHKAYNAADFGILLRKDHLMNMHSCPSKLGEYLLSGLPVIISRNIGYYSSLLQDKPFAFFVENSCLREHDFISISSEIDSFVNRNQNKENRKYISKISAPQLSLSYQNTQTNSWINGALL